MQKIQQPKQESGAHCTYIVILTPVYGTDWDTTFCESENAKVTTGNCELVAFPKFSTAHGRALHWHKNTSRTIMEKYSSLYREYFATVKYNEMYNSMETMTTQDSKDPMQKASEYPPAYV